MGAVRGCFGIVSGLLKGVVKNHFFVTPAKDSETWKGAAIL
jgi:hypothetical protein